MMTKRLGFMGGGFLFAVLGSIVLTGCPASNNGGGTQNPDANTGPGDDINDTLSGQVSALDGTPIPGVAVTLSTGQSASTDDNGFYSFGGLTSGNKVVARFKADGFASTSKSLTVGTTPGCVFLAPAGETKMISADSGSTQRSSDSAVTLEAGTLVDADGNPVSGEVALTTTFLDPSTEGVMAFPGSFDDAETASGGATSLESFGFAVYDLEQNGKPVNLADGATADIEYVLPDNAQNRFIAGDTIPLWEFDDDTAMWVEAGQGQIGLATDGSGRLAWFATVSHFSSWNCDAPITEKHCLTGRVVADGAGVAGAEVSAVGVDYNGTSTVRSDGDGNFCVEVKRGSNVRLEVRLNGGATAVVTQDVTVPTAAADCATGGCTDLGELAVTLDACVSGKVLNPDGTPAAGVTVSVVPGRSTITDSNGNFCAAAAADREVYVFAQGRPSVAVTATGSGACGGSSCATADLNYTLPSDGDPVGSIVANYATTYDGFTPGGTTSYSLNASFVTVDAETLAGSSAGESGGTTDTQTIGDCTVTTTTSSVSTNTSTDQPPDFSASLGGIGALDPGDPGVASVGSASVDLLRGDPYSIDPPAPYLAGFFSPQESSDELIALGFGAGQMIDVGFPGGADLGAFETSLAVPAQLVVTSPDLSDSSLALSRNDPLNLAWVAGNASDAVDVTISSAYSDTSVGTDGTVAYTSTAVSINCQFPDTGSATIPASAMSMLPVAGTSTTTFISLQRTTQDTVAVPLHRVSGNGTVYLYGSSGVSRSIFELPDFTDLCSFITCPTGQTCNPDTLLCE